MNKPVLIKFVSNNAVAKAKSDSWTMNIPHIDKRVNTHHINLRHYKHQFKLVMHDPITLKPVYTTNEGFSELQGSKLWEEYLKSTSLVELK
tara:strand:- start:636 stop:908 length:273 start_codon:yes stop_codon:yes gene_type:complete